MTPMNVYNAGNQPDRIGSISFDKIVLNISKVMQRGLDIRTQNSFSPLALVEVDKRDTYRPPNRRGG